MTAWTIALCCPGPAALPARAANVESVEVDSMHYNALTPAEERVIVHKGTEPPFSGKYHDTMAEGTYVCRRCNAPLYPSTAKFRSSCGWPSFDDAFPGAVRRLPDPDGRRTEIVCARCNGHLGHVFEGEGHTPKDTRYCVNSLSLDFVAADPAVWQTAVFAGGCFWGVEYLFDGVPGVVSTTVGYIGGTTENPTYRQVCAGGTGHAEAVQIVFEPRLVGYEDLCRRFFEIHDPTQLNRQGPDVGVQYRSAVFFQDEAQRKVADRLIEKLRQKGLAVVTEVVPAARFWPAEDYHQDYYQRTGHQPYCHVRVERF